MLNHFYTHKNTPTVAQEQAQEEERIKGTRGFVWALHVGRDGKIKRSIDQSQSLPDRSVDRWARSRLSVFGVV